MGYMILHRRIIFIGYNNKNIVQDMNCEDSSTVTPLAGLSRHVRMIIALSGIEDLPFGQRCQSINFS